MFFIRIAGLETRQLNQAAKLHRLVFVPGDQAPAMLLFLGQGRRYQQRWVEGWYFNPIYPGTYYYAVFKY